MRAKIRKLWHTRKMLMVLLLFDSLILLFYAYHFVFAPPPAGSTCTILANARFNPTQGLADDSNNIYVAKSTLTVNNITFPNRSLMLTKGSIGYWVNVTSGTNREIHIYQWFTDNEVTQFFLATGVSYSMRLYVGSLGSPKYVTEGVTWSYSGGYVDFSATGPITVAFFWTDYNYIFYGLYNETTGIFEGAVTVRSYFTDGTSPDTFTVNGTYTYGASSKPQYFYFELGTHDREYWTEDDEDSGVIYIYNDTLTTYTITFLDLAGVTKDRPIVEAKFYINGTLRTVEKRKVDIEPKIVMNLVNGRKYTIVLKDSSSYTYGDLLMTSTTSMTITLKGIEFPMDNLFTFQYVQIRCERDFATPIGNITITYSDSLDNTTYVEITVKLRNGIAVSPYPYNETDSTFTHVYSSAANDTDYWVEATIHHASLGTLPVSWFLPRSLSEAPWSLDFLGTFPFTSSSLIPVFFILCFAGLFSTLNAPLGAFVACMMALLLTYMGWIPIGGGALIAAIAFSVMMALIYAKRRAGV